MVIDAGTFLGYQGNYSGDPNNPTGVHLHFSIVKDDGLGYFRNELEIQNFYISMYYSGKIEDKREKLLYMSYLLFAHESGREVLLDETERKYLTHMLLPNDVKSKNERTSFVYITRKRLRR